MHNFCCVSFLKILALHNNFKKFTSTQYFCNYVNFFVILICLKYFQDIWMVKALKNLNFSKDAILLFFAHANFVHNFDSSLGFGPKMTALSYFSICTSSEDVAHLILLMNILVIVQMVEYQHFLIEPLQSIKRYFRRTSMGCGRCQTGIIHCFKIIVIATDWAVMVIQSQIASHLLTIHHLLALACLNHHAFGHMPLLQHSETRLRNHLFVFCFQSIINLIFSHGRVKMRLHSLIVHWIENNRSCILRFDFRLGDTAGRHATYVAAIIASNRYAHCVMRIIAK